MPTFNPVQAPGRPGFRVTFRNPVNGGKLTTAGLGTRDETEARALCNDLEALSGRKDLWQESESPELLAYDPRAVAILFGTDSPQARYMQGQSTPRPALAPTEADALESAAANAELLREIGKVEGVSFKGAASLAEVLQRIPSAFFQRFRESEDARRKLETKLKALAPRVEYLAAR